MLTIILYIFNIATKSLIQVVLLLNKLDFGHKSFLDIAFGNFVRKLVLFVVICIILVNLNTNFILRIHLLWFLSNSVENLQFEQFFRWFPEPWIKLKHILQDFENLFVSLNKFEIKSDLLLIILDLHFLYILLGIWR